jgi:adenosylmethionine-8-amino-7-oxononanoate aminotransferase
MTAITGSNGVDGLPSPTGPLSGARSALLKQNLKKSYPMVSHGHGVFLYDTDGREYLDGSSGAMTASVGHGVVEIAQAMEKQARLVAFSYRTQFTNAPAEDLSRKLTDLAPNGLNAAFFVSSGSEATEFAIRAAVKHWSLKGRPDKVKVLGRRVSYHGMTLGALSMSGHAARRPDYGTLLHPFPVADPAHHYRYAKPGESEAEYAARAVAEIEAAIVDQDPDTVAALIVEPIVGAAGGVLVPPAGYLAALRTICDQLDVLLIADEVITGAGRTGDWFACEHEKVVPDMLVFGKGISGGYAPVAGVLLHDHMVDTLRTGTGEAPFGHTFSANPLGAATCLAVLDLLERDNVIANVRHRGEQLGRALRQLAERHSHMADVRGRGLLWGFEFVTDPATKAPPAVRHDTSSVFVEECAKAGLIVYPGGIAPLNNSAIVCPPLTITETETTLLLRKLDVALWAMGARIEDWRAGRDNP